MHVADRPAPARHGLRAGTPWWCFLPALGLGLLTCPRAPAQDQRPSLRLGGVQPAGVRSSATESWGTFEFNLTNFTDTDRQARVLVFYQEQPDVQYGRDVWVPARANISSWLLVGPAPFQPHARAREVEMLLYDRTGGQERLILPPGTERVRSRLVLYHKREKREPYTAILLDEDRPAEPGFGELPRPPSRSEEAVDFVRVFRHSRNLSELVPTVHDLALPLTPEAFDGIDQLVLASGRLVDDPLGRQALRRWLERGGTLWVMLDLVDLEGLAPLLGDAFDFQVVDRVGLTSFQIESLPALPGLQPPQLQQHERPVDLVRVLLPPGERARLSVNGWPLWFSRPVGRGKVVCTTLGPRGWYRPRKAKDPPSRYENFPLLPVGGQDLDLLAFELQPQMPDDATAAEGFRAALTDEIGYTVLGRGTVALVFGAFLLAVLVLGLAVRRTRRPELLGWLAPAAALLAAGAFVALGVASRQAATPTLAVVQVTDAVAGAEEAPVYGQLAVYRPDSGAADLGVEQGGLFELKMTGVEGQTRRLVLTDLDAWHWENLALPAGVRTGSFRHTAPTGEPLTAVARFGPGGVEGKLTTGPFRNLADTLLTPPSGRNLAVRLGPENTFSAGSQDVLPTGQFLTGTVLTDRQQRRQWLYREFLSRPPRERRETRPLLLAWAEPIDLHFALGTPAARTVGGALLVLPLRLERPAVGARVTIPGPLVPYQRVFNDRLSRPTLGASAAIDQHLYFRLPEAVLPFRVERARLSARVTAPSRQVSIAARTEDGLTELRRVTSPLDPIDVDITDERLLRLDAEGGLHFHVAVSDAPEAKEETRTEERWTIEYLELEVVGQALPAE